MPPKPKPNPKPKAVKQASKAPYPGFKQEDKKSISGQATPKLRRAWSMASRADMTLDACGRILVGLLLAWLVWRYPKRVRKLSAVELRQQKSASHFMQHVVHTILLAQQDYQTLLPQLAEAPRISAHDFGPDHRIDCRRDADGDFAVVALERALFSQLTALATCQLSKWAINPKTERAALDGLVTALLKHVDAPPYVDSRGRARPPQLSDCIYCGLSI